MPMYESLPKDPVMLLSFINTKLRDTYPAFDDFAKDYHLNPEEIRAVMKTIDYEYDASVNQFI